MRSRKDKQNNNKLYDTISVIKPNKLKIKITKGPIKAIDYNTSQNYKFFTLYSNLKSKYDKIEDILPNNLLNKFLLIPNLYSFAKESADLIYENLTLISKALDKKINKEASKLHKYNITSALKAISSFMEVIINISKLSEDITSTALKLELELFKMAFHFELENNNLGYNATIYPVFLHQKEFLFDKYPYILLQSSTGSGKTRCAPFIFSLRILFESFRSPFFIMTQPSTAIANEKIDDFKSFVGDSVIVINSIKELISLYQIKNHDKPIVGIFSPYKVLKLISITKKMNLNIFKKTRFCLDEIHERTIETDTLISFISENIELNPFPVQVTLMSATPDKYIIKSFEGAKIIELEESSLFPVELTRKTIKNSKEATAEVSEAIFSLIDEIKRHTLDKGHILAFLPGNRMIMDVMRMVEDQYKNDDNIFSIPSNFICEKDSYDSIVQRLRDVAQRNEDKMIIFPIKLAGFVPSDHKQIAQKPLPKDIDSHIIKIICATNAVESSITILNTAAVVDSGLHNSPNFDNEREVTSLRIKPITKKMQTQRKGRVGRTRPGRVVQFTLDGKVLSDDIEPAIMTSDLSISIISLRLIGINLEELTHLPNNPGKLAFDEAIDNLKSLEIIGEDNKLTSFGRDVYKLSNINPSYASAAIHLSEQYPYYTKEFIQLCASFLILIMTSKNLVYNNKADLFQKNFCQQSDIVTLAKSMVECRKKRLNPSICGFNDVEFKSIYQGFMRIFNNLIGKESTQDFWNDYEKFFEENDMIKFINKIIDFRTELKPKWRTSHTLNFQSLFCIPLDIKYIYNEKGNDVYIKERPGSNNLKVPKEVMVFSIQSNLDVKKTFGEIIHNCERKPYEFGTPFHLYEDDVCLSDFFSFLINRYISTSPNTNKFIAMSPTKKKELTQYVYVSQLNGKATLTFIPKMQDAIDFIKEAIQCVKKLMPYTGRSILIKSIKPSCAIEIFNFGCNEYSSNVYDFNDYINIPKCYNITYNIIRTLCDNMLPLLAKQDNKVRIAITGEAMSFSLQNLYSESISKQIIPAEDQTYAFENENQIILMVSNDVEGIKDEPLNWNILNFEKELKETEKFNYKMSNMGQSLIELKKCENWLYLYKNSCDISINKRKPVNFKNMDDFLKYLKQKYERDDNFRIESLEFLNDFTEDELDKIDYVFENSPKYIKNICPDYGCLILDLELPSQNEQMERINQVINLFEYGPKRFKKQKEEEEDKEEESEPFYGVKFNKFDVVNMKVLNVKHKSTSALSANEFNNAVDSVTSKYHFICMKNNYQHVNEKGLKGKIQIKVMDEYFALRIAKEIKKKIKGNKIQLKIPSLIIPKHLFKLPIVSEEIKKWSENHGLESISLDDKYFVGTPSDVRKAIDLLNVKSTTIKLPYKFIELPRNIDEHDIQNLIRINNMKKNERKRWIFMENEYGVVVPTEEEEYAKKIFNINKVARDDVIGCYNYCEKPETSQHNVTVYYKDGKTKTKPLCVDCTYDILEYATSSFFSSEYEIDFNYMKEIIDKLKTVAIEDERMNDNGEMWPKCPFGQLFWEIVKESRLRVIAKSWITAVCFQTMHTNPNVLIFCPKHPHKLISLYDDFHGEIKCEDPECDLIYLKYNNEWCDKKKAKMERKNVARLDFYERINGGKNKKLFDIQKSIKTSQKELEIINSKISNGEKIELKKCPKCGRETIKTEGCNHISCPCGAHWCYECGAGPFSTEDECYKHMHNEHGGFFNKVNDAIDLEKRKETIENTLKQLQREETLLRKQLYDNPENEHLFKREWFKIKKEWELIDNEYVRGSYREEAERILREVAKRERIRREIEERIHEEEERILCEDEEIERILSEDEEAERERNYRFSNYRTQYKYRPF